MAAKLISDPVLALHRVSEFRYELSGLRTGSVRDQMLRGMLLVERLIDTGKLLQDGKPLLVIGGGVAGVTATLTAARSGIDVTLIEKSRGPFYTQLAATSRRLNPTEFDWPQPHWNKGTAKWGLGKFPLPYHEQSAVDLARLWGIVFEDWIKNQRVSRTRFRGVVDYVFGVDATDFVIDDGPSGGVELKDKADPLAGTETYAVAISCVGFSGERVSAGSYRGYEFWGEDTLDEPNLGVDGKSVRFLVSGGGDGAQQDFLRALTGTFGRDLYDKLLREGLPNPRGLHALLEATMAEDSAHRAFAWSDPNARPSGTLWSWNRAYYRLVDETWSKWSNASRKAAASKLLRRGVFATWNVGGDGPDFCYGLNRFTALLVARLHAESSSPTREWRTPRLGAGYAVPADEVMVFGHYLQGVDASAHRCSRPASCIGVPHTALLSLDPIPAPHDPVYRIGPFDVIAVRHGVDQAPYFATPTFREQIVPFDAPR